MLSEITPTLPSKDGRGNNSGNFLSTSLEGEMPEGQRGLLRRLDYVLVFVAAFANLGEDRVYLRLFGIKKITLQSLKCPARLLGACLL